MMNATHLRVPTTTVTQSGAGTALGRAEPLYQPTVLPLIVGRRIRMYREVGRQAGREAGRQAKEKEKEGLQKEWY